ncbi:MAG TPA: hypothetical protein VFM88_14410 [Vicinamibacteria bacterium]|nr:hypothetical protein [Vicinamibacteria bacterium]
MARRADPGDQVRSRQRPLGDEEERGAALVAREDVEDLRCEDGIRAVVEAERHERLDGLDTPQHARQGRAEDREGPERLGGQDRDEPGDRQSDRDRHAPSTGVTLRLPSHDPAEKSIIAI